MNTQPKIIVITGAESTGKSELTQLLAGKYNAPFVPEYARDYVEGLNRHYRYQDVEHIARQQIEELNRLINSDNQFIFADTWLIITKVWFEVVYGSCPEWVEQAILNTRIDMFLVCDIDLPWQPDQVRENGGEKRVALHEKYIATLKEYKFNYRVVSGKNEERLNHAIAHLSSLIS